jgi:hypothetical protein
VTGMRDREAKDLLEVIRSRARLVRELYLDLQVSSALCFFANYPTKESPLISISDDFFTGKLRAA